MFLQSLDWITDPTMDVDATIIGFPLSIESAREIVEEITSIPLNGGMLFEIRNVTTIMNEPDHSGVRVALMRY